MKAKEVRNLIDKATQFLQDNFGREIVTALSKSPAELLDEKRTRYKTYPIVLHFPSFFRWLASHQAPILWVGRTKPNQRTAAEWLKLFTTFSSERDNYVSATGEVSKQLDAIEKVPPGGMLLSAIKAGARFPIHISPDPIFMFTGTADADASIRQLAAIKQMTSTGMPILDEKNQPAKTKDGEFAGSGEGTGDESFVSYSPEAFAAKSTAPGTTADAELFHELVHASRQISGNVYFLHVTGGYDNEEEYLAVVLTNIYIRAASKTAALRADHAEGVLSADEEAKFIDNAQSIDLSVRMLLERFRLHQPGMFGMLAQLSEAQAKFNPVRNYDQELKAGKSVAGERKP